jgi:Predicted metal-binding protein
MTKDSNSVMAKAEELGLTAYMLNASDIDVENRAKLKCAYGCRGYGKRLSCPPHIISIDEFREILKEYNTAILLIEEHDTSAENDIFKAWSRLRKGSFNKMLELEHDAFRDGFTYAQLLRPGACNECEACGDVCNKPEMRRFPPEAVGINLSKLMEKNGLEMEYCNFDRVKCVGILLLE